MSDLIIPGNRTPVQISEKQRVCVLIHAETKRILCFALDDAFASEFQDKGYIKKEIHHAHEYDMWAKRIREQQKREDEEEDYVYLEKENAVRQRLRKELRARISHLHNGVQRAAVDQALHCLDVMEARRQRKREESFMVQEAYEQSKNPGEEIVNKVMVPKK